jgi:ribose/xylose/arabinose/galactoside ABC-type transport system permease subunit
MDFKAVIGTLAMLAFLALGLVQLVIGYHGLDVQFGSPWALIGAILAFLRFTPPLIVGIYFGAIDLWGWHPIGAAIFAAPGLLLLIPGIIGAVLDKVRR